MNSRFLLLATLIFVFGACQTNPNEKNLKPDRLNWKSSNDKNKKGEELISYGGYPVYVKNLSIVNSVFDDYNMAKPGEGERSTFLFSSNRNSKGKDFDIVQYNALTFYYKYSNKRATVRLENDFCPMSNEIKKMLKKVNTSENEYGPYIFDLKDNFEFLFFYAQEVAGKLQLKMMANKLDSLKGSRCYLKEYGPFDIKLLNNKTYNVAYPSIQNSLLYYCSDKTGDFDIFQHQIDTTIHTGKAYIDFLTNKAANQSSSISAINSPWDDKCPYVFEDFMVFTSNRKGGFGGYDLWYSRLENGVWSVPKNFGPKINTKYDEYRPIVSINRGIPNDLLLFSSNRPNGKGGYDLYYIGIKVSRKS